MKTADSPTNGTVLENDAGKRGGADQHWQTAGDRVLLYLRCLNFPAPQALELALGSIKVAERSTSLGSGNSPVLEAMQALRQLLSEKESGMFERSHSPDIWCGRAKLSSPPLHRLPMVPEKGF
jgi:hypothetical protein